jgi:predicted S18 family serine protease
MTLEERVERLERFAALLLRERAAEAADEPEMRRLEEARQEARETRDRGRYVSALEKYEAICTHGRTRFTAFYREVAALMEEGR